MDILSQLKSGKSIKDVLQSRSEKVVERKIPSSSSLPRMPTRPPILRNEPEELSEPNKEMLDQEIPKELPVKTVSFDVNKLKNQIKEILSKVTPSYSLIHYLSDETGISSEQIVKVILDMLKERLDLSINDDQTPAQEKPKLAFPEMESPLPDIAKEENTPTESEQPKRPTLQERAMKGDKKQVQSTSTQWD